MKIIMLGPVYPYKGGISHYTALMSRALMKSHEVINVSYSLQYPKLLYPGSSQKEYGNDSLKIENARFILNTVNPLSYIKTASFIRKTKPDLVIFQWWHPFFAPAYWVILKVLRKKIKVVFLCHNVLPHEKFPFQKALTAAVLKQGDAFIIHSSPDEHNLRELLGENYTNIKKNVHPAYQFMSIKKKSKAEARKELKINNDIILLLFFGFVREYKGLKILLDAFPKILVENESCKLLIAGDFLKNEKCDYIDRIDFCKQKTGDSIIVVDKYIPDNEIEKYFAACDLVVLPYLSATQSGVVQIAYGFNKPVVVTNVGGLPEVVIDGETGYIVPPNDAGALADAVNIFLHEPNKEKFAENIAKEAYKYSWDRLTEVVEELYQQN
jgi:glycosyltransferase involved in cell wall biosynthesis